MNGIKKCPSCQKEIDVKATKCPYCQTDMRIWIRKHPIGTLIIVLVLVPIFVSGMLSGTSTPVSQTDQIARMKTSSAESFARSYVKSTLKAPSTAKFGYGVSVKEDPKKANTFDVISDVTSENSYGAHLTSPWSVKMRYSGPDTREGIDDGINWTVDEFYFDGEKIK